jgi:hypothetical protein
LTSNRIERDETLPRNSADIERLCQIRRKVLVNAVIVHVGPGTNLSGLPTYQELGWTYLLHPRFLTYKLLSFFTI